MTTTNAAPKYSLVGHKSLAGASHETVCCHGRLACDGRIVGTYENSGHGGPFLINIKSPADRDAFAAFIAAHPPVPSEFSDEPLKMTEDLFLGLLVEEAEKAKWFARQAKKNTLFTLPGDAPGSFRTIKRPADPQVIAHIRAKYPTATIYGADGSPVKE